MTKLSRIAALLILNSIICFNLNAQKAQEGLLDARSIDFNSQRLRLDGQWMWIDNELVFPYDYDHPKSVPVEFPKLWNDIRNGGNGQGFATYSLTLLLGSHPKELALEIPQMYSSYTLWLNGNVISQNGKVSNTEESSIPQWLPKTVVINVSDTLDFVLQISNFRHDKGGCKESIILGQTESALLKESISKKSKILEFILLLLIALGFKLVYMLKERKKVIMYFSLLCATWAIRSVFSNEYLAINYIPNFSWITMVRIEYITIYLTMIWSVLFLSRIFPNESNHIVKYIIVVLNVVFIVSTSFNPPLFFSKLLAFYLATAGILIVYAVIVIIRAYINERTGALSLILSSFLGIVTFSYDIFTYEGVFAFRSILLTSAYLIMFSMMAVVLLLHLDIIKRSKPTSNTLTYNDLYGNEKK